MQKKDEAIGRQITFEISGDIEGGVYSNVASVVHSAGEFIFDFAIIVPGKKAAQVKTRVITNPAHAKQFLTALEENVARYEKAFGEIKPPVQPEGNLPTRTVH